MNHLAPRTLVLIVLATLGSGVPAHAQRRAADGAAGGAAGAAVGVTGAKLIYRNDFENAGDAGFEASAYGSAKFMTGASKEQADKAKVSGFTVGVTGQPDTAYGSQGALKIAVTSPDAQSITAERYFDWPTDDATVAMLIYAHGVSGFYLQGWGKNAGRNLHADAQIDKQDTWQFVKLNASAFTGWGGGAVTPGESFRNLMIVPSERDKAVDSPFLLVDNFVIYQGSDRVPPSAPADVKAVVDPKSGVVLTWKPATDDVCVAAYEVHRSTEEGFKPASKTRIATLSALQYADRDTQPGQTYHYVIVAKDAGGNKTPAAAVTVATSAAAPGGGKKEEF